MGKTPIPPTARFTRANGIEICYEEFGDPKAPPLLLIMGLGAQMIVWDEDFCNRLAGRGYRLIRFDNRDVGLSTHFAEAGVPNLGRLVQALSGRKEIHVPYTLRDMADDAVGLLNALGLDSAHWVGVSMGGMIAQTAAIYRAHAVRTLTSIMSTTGEPGLEPPTPEAQKVLYTPAPTQREDFVEHYLMTRRVIQGNGFPLDEAKERALAWRIFERGVDPAGVGRQLAAVMASGSRKELLRLLRIPTLVIHGEADPLIPLSAGRATAESIPGAKLLTIPGMGHSLPKAVWPQIIEAIVEHAR